MVDKIQIDYDKVIELINKGYTQIEIGKELGIGKNTIISFLKENNIKTKHQTKTLVGQIFGKLTVIDQVESINNRKAYLCRCECKNTKIVKGKYLSNGDTRSCGCHKDFEKYQEKNYKEALKKIGEKYGKLTIIDVVIDKNKRQYKMVCKCECGSISNKCYNQMKLGQVVSCGCYARELSSIRGSKQGIYELNKNKNWYFIKDNKNIKCRSGYEVIYANYLTEHNIVFEYEPKCFRLPNKRRYTPDFYLVNEDKYIEIKGIDYNVFDISNQKSKIDLFKEIYDLDIYYWKDLVRICSLPYKHYSRYKRESEKLGLKIEDYIGKKLYFKE